MKLNFKEHDMLAAPKMVVMVSCKNCGKGFRLTAVRIDTEQNLKTNTFSNVNEVCPHCGQRNTYNEKSMIWRE
jgi:ribosomal protein L32